MSTSRPSRAISSHRFDARRVLRNGVRVALRYRAPSGRQRAVTWALCAVVFSAAGVWSLASSSMTVRANSVPLLLASLLSLCVTQVALGYEYHLMARLAQCDVSLVSATQVSLRGSIANFLPFPGSIAVRVVHLHRSGAQTRQVARATGTVAAVSVASAACVAVGLLGGGWWIIAMSAGILPVMWFMIRVYGSNDRSPLWKLVATQGLLLGPDAIRLWMLAFAFSIDIDVRAAVILTLAPVMSTAVGIAPAGLGLREGFSALLATSVGMSSADAVSLSVADTAVRIAGIGACALLVATMSTRRMMDGAVEHAHAA